MFYLCFSMLLLGFVLNPILLQTEPDINHTGELVASLIAVWLAVSLMIKEKDKCNENVNSQIS